MRVVNIIATMQEQLELLLEVLIPRKGMMAGLKVPLYCCLTKEAMLPRSPPYSQHERASVSGRVPVDGDRRVLGDYAFCTPAAIQSGITKLTSVQAMFRVKRKTKVLLNNKCMWWFVIHSEESV